MNGYMHLINERDLHLHGRRTVYAFSCYFFTQLSVDGYAYDRVRKWTRRANIDVFKLDKIIFPLNIDNSHWVLAVVDLKAQEIQYFDSLGGNHPALYHRLRRWLGDECLDKGAEFSLEGWRNSRPSCPKQSNSCDCGVFACCFAERLALGAPIDFTQRHIPALRLIMSLELTNKKLAFE